MGRSRGLGLTAGLMLLAVSCGGGDEAGTSTTVGAPSTAPAITTTSSIAAPQPTTTTTVALVNPGQPVYFVGGSDLPSLDSLSGWDISHSTFVHDDDSGVQVGWHTVLAFPSCDRPAPPGARTLLESLEFDDVAQPWCETGLVVDQTFVSIPDGVQVDRTVESYESGPLTMTSTAYWTGPGGSRLTASGARVRDDVVMSVQAEGDDRMSGAIKFSNGTLGIEAWRVPWPHPYSLELGRRFLEQAAAWVPTPPSLDALASVPPAGLKAVWFECRRPENEGDEADRIKALRENAACRRETEEARLIASALDWELVVVEYRPGNHAPQSAYPEALAVDPDVIIARGGLGGQWTDSTIAQLQASGVVIVDNRIDDFFAGQIDKSVLPSVDWIEQGSVAPFLQTWVAVDSGYEAVAGVYVEAWQLNLAGVCGACQRLPIERPAGSPTEGLKRWVAEHPDVQYVMVGWDDVDLPSILESVGRDDVTILGYEGTSAREATPAGNKVWWAFDAAVRSLVAGEPFQREYLQQPPRLVVGAEPQLVDESFRQAFKDAWGV